MESKRTATTYFIPPGKFLLIENALGNPDLIQSSVSSDCRVTIVDSANFPLDELEQWPTFRLTSADIKLKLGGGAYYIYIVVPTTDNTESTSAFISYNTALVDRDGYQVIETEDEEGNPKLEKGPLLGKSGFKYYQCGVISARGGNASAITAPAGQGRLLSVDLGVNPQDANLEKKVDWDFFYSLFIPHYDDPKDPTKLTWIEAKSHMGIQGGVTMFIEGEGMDLPSIYDGLPIDMDTIYWEEIKDEEGNVIGKRLKARVGSGEGGSADFSSVFESGSGNAYTSFVLSEDGKGLTFVKGETFAKQSDYEALNNKVSDFLEGSDTDEIINKWKELESFLSGMKESDNLATILSTKWTKDDDKIDNWDAAYNWGNHANAGYLKDEDVSRKYLKLAGGTMGKDSSIISAFIYPIEDNKYALGLLNRAYGYVYSHRYFVNDLEIKKSQDDVIFIDANLVVRGGITMYGTDGTTAPSIWDGAPVADTRGGKGVASFDPNYFTVDNGVVKFIGKSGGGIESITKQMVLDALGYTPYNSTNPNGYITSSGNAATATKVMVNTSNSNTTFPILFTDTKQATTSGTNGSVYCDTASGAGYNPSTNSFIGNGFWGNSVTLGNGVSASIKTKGWYRFATTINAENEAGGSLIFSIRRQYNNYKTESHIIAVSVGYSAVTFTQIAGAPSDALITKVRATNTKDGVIYFDFYYGVDTTSAHNVYVNCIGSASLQTPTSTTQLLSYVTEFDLVNGFKSNVLHFTSLNNLGYLRSKCGKNLLVGGDNLSGGTSYAFAGYSYDSAVKVNRTYRLTICGKLGENTSHIYAYWDGGSGNNTYIGGLSKTEERIITVRAKITNKGSSNRLVFYKFNSSNTQETTSYSYIRWAYLEEEFQEGELSTTTDYNNWLTEYNKRDTKTFLHKIQRIDVGDSYWSADNGLKLIDANAYAITMKRTASSGGTFIKMMANNQNTQSWAIGVNNVHQFSWWYQNGTSDTQKMYLDSSGNLLTTGGITMYSDLRKKTILNHVELSLKEVADAPLIEHYYNSDEKKVTHVGSVAQYWVKLNNWFCKDDGEGFLTMEIQNAALASAISVARELTRYESKTDKKIKKLKKRIGELEEEIENLKNK